MIVHFLNDAAVSRNHLCTFVIPSIRPSVRKKLVLQLLTQIYRYTQKIISNTNVCIRFFCISVSLVLPEISSLLYLKFCFECFVDFFGPTAPFATQKYFYSYEAVYMTYFVCLQVFFTLCFLTLFMDRFLSFDVSPQYLHGFNNTNT